MLIGGMSKSKRDGDQESTKVRERSLTVQSVLQRVLMGRG